MNTKVINVSQNDIPTPSHTQGSIRAVTPENRTTKAKIDIVCSTSAKTNNRVKTI